jgi:sodium-dependent dicarboxylate transporter 2/3/5
MDWKTAEQGMPWGIVILFGGGFALAAGMQQTGLAEWIGGLVTGLRGIPVWVLVPVACGTMLLLTEMTSNVATTLMMCPVLAEAALELGLDPYLLLVPCTFMASFAFMLPVATPPNAVVFSSGWITIPAMARVGAVMNLMALLFAPALIYLLSSLVLGL